MTRDPVKIQLNTETQTCELKNNLKQGSTNREFKVTLMSGERKILLDDANKISVVVVYNPRMEYDKFVYDGSFVLESTTANYNITRSKETVDGEEFTLITIPFWENFVSYAGKCKLIINVIDDTGSTDIELYTYSMPFTVDMTDAYIPKSIPNNLPAYTHLEARIKQLETDTAATEQKATDNAAAITRKADDNLANVGNFAAAPEGSIIIKKGGTLDHEGITVIGENINAPGKIINAKRINVESNTVGIGPITELHENTAFLEYHTNTLDKNYVLLDYENDPITGTKTPIYWSRLAKENQTIQDVKNQIMQNIKTINFNVPSFSRQVQNIYFDFLAAVNNLRMEIVINNTPLIYYPSKLAWEGKEPGYGPFNIGVQKIAFKPFLSNLTDYSISVNFKADGPINFKGDGTIPWYQLDFNKIVKKKVLIEGDAGTETPEQIARALEGLSEPQKLDYVTGLKNKPVIPVAPTKSTDLTDMPKPLVAGKIPQVNSSGDGYILVDKPSGGTGGTDPQTAINTTAIAKNTTELDRIKTDLAESKKIFTYRGKVTPTYPSDAQHGYYLSFYALQSTLNLTIPSVAGIENGSIFSIDNQDFNDSILLAAPAGMTIDGASRINVPTENLMFLVKKDAKTWSVAFSGFLPSSLQRVILDVKAALPANAPLTIQEIEAQLKDRLHDFASIQKEFKEQLHTYDDIDAEMIRRGFEKSGGSIGMQGDQSVPTGNNWKIKDFRPNEELLIPAQNKGDQYLVFILPTFIAPLVSDIKVNNSKSAFTEHSFIDNELDYIAFISSSAIDSTQVTRFKIDFAIKNTNGGLMVDDGSGKIIDNVDSITFENFKLEDDGGGAVTISPVPMPGSGSPVLKDVNGNEFEAKVIKSNLNDIEIHQESNQDGTLSANLNIAPHIFQQDHMEGIMACLGNDELLNSKYPKSRLYFGETRIKGGGKVYQDLTKKSFVLQDIDPQDDPNVSGGTTFLCGIYTEPSKDNDSEFSQNGYVDIDLVDDNGDFIIDVNGDPMGSRVHYLKGQKMGKELYLGECQMKGATDVHARIRLGFESEEIVSLGGNSCVVFQAIDKKESCGLALLAFMDFTGYSIKYFTKYFGNNSMNLAQFLNYNEPVEEIRSKYMSLGDNTSISVTSAVNLEIKSNHLVIKDNGTDFPVFSINKHYNEFSTNFIKDKTLKVTATLTDKDSAFIVGLLKYTGTSPAPNPEVLSYNNQSPVFATGWELVDSMFITEDVVAGEHKQSKDFIVPQDAKELSVILYPNESKISTTLLLKDLEVDITPWFNKLIITDSSNIHEESLRFEDEKYVFSVPTYPYASIRYTANTSDTNLPWGVPQSKTDKAIFNDNSWNTGGTYAFEGDGVFENVGKATLRWEARCYGGEKTPVGMKSDNQIWMAKVNTDGTFTKIQESDVEFTIKQEDKQVHVIKSANFKLDINAGDKYRILCKSNFLDGFFLEGFANGEPLLRLFIDYDKVSEEEKILLNTVSDLQETVTRIDSEFRVTKTAHDNKVYAELDYDVDNDRPSINAKKE